VAQLYVALAKKAGMLADSASNAALARGLMREAPSAALATLQADGGPFASYVTTAPSPDGSPLLLLSRLAVHSRNLERDPRASLLFVREAGSEAMAALRVTLMGRAVKDDDPKLKELFLSRHPDAARYAGFGDFSLHRFEIAAGHLVAGFGRIVELTAAELSRAADN
jgi:putative heme iron utilization protein